MNLSNKPQSLRRKLAKGFSIVELLIVLAIGGVLAIIGIPFAQDIIIGGKVEPIGSDINKVAAKFRTNFAGQGAAPYLNVTDAIMGSTGRGVVSALSITPAGILAHDIGGAGAVNIAPGAPAGMAPAPANGATFTITATTVEAAACPGLAAQMSRSAEFITVNGAVAKQTGANYDGAAATAACVPGPNNTFGFTFR